MEEYSVNNLEDVSNLEYMDNVIKTEIVTEKILTEVDHVLMLASSDLINVSISDTDGLFEKIQQDLTDNDSNQRDMKKDVTRSITNLNLNTLVSNENDSSNSSDVSTIDNFSDCSDNIVISVEGCRLETNDESTIQNTPRYTSTPLILQKNRDGNNYFENPNITPIKRTDITTDSDINMKNTLEPNSHNKLLKIPEKNKINKFSGNERSILKNRANVLVGGRKMYNLINNRTSVNSLTTSENSNDLIVKAVRKILHNCKLSKNINKNSTFINENINVNPNKTQKIIDVNKNSESNQTVCLNKTEFHNQQLNVDNETTDMSSNDFRISLHDQCKTITKPSSSLISTTSKGLEMTFLKDYKLNQINTNRNKNLNINHNKLLKNYIRYVTIENHSPKITLLPSPVEIKRKGAAPLHETFSLIPPNYSKTSTSSDNNNLNIVVIRDFQVIINKYNYDVPTSRVISYNNTSGKFLQLFFNKTNDLFTNIQDYNAEVLDSGNDDLYTIPSADSTQIGYIDNNREYSKVLCNDNAQDTIFNDNKSMSSVFPIMGTPDVNLDSVSSESNDTDSMKSKPTECQIDDSDSDVELIIDIIETISVSSDSEEESQMVNHEKLIENKLQFIKSENSVIDLTLNVTDDTSMNLESDVIDLTWYDHNLVKPFGTSTKKFNLESEVIDLTCYDHNLVKPFGINEIVDLTESDLELENEEINLETNTKIRNNSNVDAEPFEITSTDSKQPMVVEIVSSSDGESSTSDLMKSNTEAKNTPTTQEPVISRNDLMSNPTTELEQSDLKSTKNNLFTNPQVSVLMDELETLLDISVENPVKDFKESGVKVSEVSVEGERNNMNVLKLDKNLECMEDSVKNSTKDKEILSNNEVENKNCTYFPGILQEINNLIGHNKRNENIMSNKVMDLGRGSNVANKQKAHEKIELSNDVNNEILPTEFINKNSTDNVITPEIELHNQKLNKNTPNKTQVVPTKRSKFENDNQLMDINKTKNSNTTDPNSTEEPIKRKRKQPRIRNFKSIITNWIKSNVSVNPQNNPKEYFFTIRDILQKKQEQVQNNHDTSENPDLNNSIAFSGDSTHSKNTTCESLNDHNIQTKESEHNNLDKTITPRYNNSILDLDTTLTTNSELRHVSLSPETNLSSLQCISKTFDNNIPLIPDINSEKMLIPPVMNHLKNISPSKLVTNKINELDCNKSISPDKKPSKIYIKKSFFDNKIDLNKLLDFNRILLSSEVDSNKSYVDTFKNVSNHNINTKDVLNEGIEGSKTFSVFEPSKSLDTFNQTMSQTPHTTNRMITTKTILENNTKLHYKNFTSNCKVLTGIPDLTSNVSVNSKLTTDIPKNSTVTNDILKNSSLSSNIPTNSLLTTENQLSLMTNVPKNLSLMTDLRTNSSLMTNLPKNSSIMTDLPENSSLMIDINKNSLLITDVNKNSSLMTDLPINSSLMTDLPINSSLMTDLPINSSLMTDLPKNSSLMTDSPKNSSLMIDVPKSSSLMTDLPKNSSIMTDLPKNSSVTTEILKSSLLTTNVPKITSVTTNIPQNSLLITSLAENSQQISNVPENVATTNVVPINLRVMSNTVSKVNCDAKKLDTKHVPLILHPALDRNKTKSLVCKSLLENKIGFNTGKSDINIVSEKDLNIVCNSQKTDTILKTVLENDIPSNLIIPKDKISFNGKKTDVLLTSTSELDIMDRIDLKTNNNIHCNNKNIDIPTISKTENTNKNDEKNLKVTTNILLDQISFNDKKIDDELVISKTVIENVDCDKTLVLTSKTVTQLNDDSNKSDGKNIPDELKTEKVSKPASNIKTNTTKTMTLTLQPETTTLIEPFTLKKGSATTKPVLSLSPQPSTSKAVPKVKNNVDLFHKSFSGRPKLKRRVSAEDVEHPSVKKQKMENQIIAVGNSRDDTFVDDADQNFTRLLFHSQNTIDENDPNWRDIKDLVTSDEFFHHVSKQWQTETLPNPLKNLTKRFVSCQSKDSDKEPKSDGCLSVDYYLTNRIKHYHLKINSIENMLKRSVFGTKKKKGFMAEINKYTRLIHNLEKHRDEMIQINRFYLDLNSGWDAKYLTDTQFNDLQEQDETFTMMETFYRQI